MTHPAPSSQTIEVYAHYTPAKLRVDFFVHCHSCSKTWCAGNLSHLDILPWDTFENALLDISSALYKHTSHSCT